MLLLDLAALGLGRIHTLIRVVALQGALIGTLPLVLGHTAPAMAALVVAAVALKGLVIPRMLGRAMRTVGIRNEMEAIVGLLPSMLLGAAATGGCVLLAEQLPLAPQHAQSLLVPASLATMTAGFVLLIARLKAITQVLGYLVLENGVFLFGTLLLDAMPVAIELGVLLDLWVAMFVIGIIVHHIQREFASLDTRRLTSLRE